MLKLRHFDSYKRLGRYWKRWRVLVLQEPAGLCEVTRLPETFEVLHGHGLCAQGKRGNLRRVVGVRLIQYKLSTLSRLTYHLCFVSGVARRKTEVRWGSYQLVNRCREQARQLEILS